MVIQASWGEESSCTPELHLSLENLKTIIYDGHPGILMWGIFLHTWVAPEPSGDPLMFAD